MTVYENAALWSRKKGFFEKGTYNDEDMDLIVRMDGLAHAYGEPVYMIREFVVVDAEYNDHAPSKVLKDWYVLESKPNV